MAGFAPPVCSHAAPSARAHVRPDEREARDGPRYPQFNRGQILGPVAPGPKTLWVGAGVTQNRFRLSGPLAEPHFL